MHRLRANAAKGKEKKRKNREAQKPFLALCVYITERIRNLFVIISILCVWMHFQTVCQSWARTRNTCMYMWCVLWLWALLFFFFFISFAALRQFALFIPIQFSHSVLASGFWPIVVLYVYARMLYTSFFWFFFCRSLSTYSYLQRHKEILRYIRIYINEYDVLDPPDWDPNAIHSEGLWAINSLHTSSEQLLLRCDRKWASTYVFGVFQCFSSSFFSYIYILLYIFPSSSMLCAYDGLVWFFLYLLLLFFSAVAAPFVAHFMMVLCTH